MDINPVLTLEHPGEDGDGFLESVDEASAGFSSDYGNDKAEDTQPRELSLTPDASSFAVNNLPDVETRLNAALRAGDIATWTWDVVGDKAVGDPNLARLLNIESLPTGPESHLFFIHAMLPEDQPVVVEAIRKAFEETSELNVEFRVQNPDGSMRWLLARGRLERDKDGKPISLPGVLVDISARKNADEAVTRSEARFRAISEAIPQLVWSAGPDGQALYFNSRALEYTGKSQQDLLGLGFLDCIHPDDRDKAMRMWEAAYNESKILDFEYRVRRYDGVYGWFISRGEPVRDPVTNEITMWVGTLTDISERHAAEVVAQNAVRALDAAQHGYLTLDDQFRITYTNQLAGDLNSRQVSEYIGRPIWEEWPGLIGTPLEKTYHRAMTDRTREEGIFQYVSKNTAKLMMLEMNIYPDEHGGGLHIIYRDVTDRVWREECDRFLAALGERSRLMEDPQKILDDAVASVCDFLRVERCAFVDIDFEHDSCYVTAQHRVEGVIEMPRPLRLSDYGPYVTTEFAAGRSLTVNDIYTESDKISPTSWPAYQALQICAYAAVPLVHSSRLVSAIAVYSTKPRTWASEELDLLALVVERTWLSSQVTRQHIALLAELDQRKEMSRREAWFTAIVQNSTDFIGLADLDRNTIFVNDAGRKLVGIPSGREGDEIVSKMKVEDFFHPSSHDFLYKDFIPKILHDGHAIGEACLKDVRTGEPIWANCSSFTVQDPEFGNVTAIATITRDIRTRKAEEAERDRLYQEEHVRAERDAVLARIGWAIRSSVSPSEVQTVAAESLGMALGCDRCFYLNLDWEADELMIPKDYTIEGLPSAARASKLSEGSVDLISLFDRNQTIVVDDIRKQSYDAIPKETSDRLATTGLMSFIAVPFKDSSGQLTSVLACSMSFASRKWSPAEVHLVEQVATETNEAVDAAIARQRERNITQRLQDALRPPSPPSFPGLRLASDYRAALNEAEVGGDGFDIFPLSPTATAVCLFDLSGKGLAAATRVATVRNMCRYALYNTDSPVEAIRNLNKTLAGRRLLEAFATLFVGVYDAEKRILTYVNCGQEPGLVWRCNTGNVDQLTTTGPVIGVLEDALFIQEHVSLNPGDIVAIFTDGMTEVGPDRSSFWGVEGLQDVFADSAQRESSANCDNNSSGSTNNIPNRIVDHMILKAEEYAGSADNLRDDIALLVMQVSDGENGPAK